MLKLNNNIVYGDSRSLRNFFNDLCDSIERQEAMWEDVEQMENQLDEALGVEAHRDELLELVRQLEETIEEKDREIERLNTLLASQKPVESNTEPLKVPKIAVKKKIIKKVK